MNRRVWMRLSLGAGAVVLLTSLASTWAALHIIPLPVAEVGPAAVVDARRTPPPDDETAEPLTVSWHISSPVSPRRRVRVHLLDRWQAGGGKMPIYEYRCKDCGHDFTIIESLEDHEVAKPTCPECKSSSVERVISSVYVQTAKKI